MKHIARFFTGLIVVALVITICCLSSGNLADIIATVIICSLILSLGLVLIIYIPLIYLVGYVTLTVTQVVSGNRVLATTESGLIKTEKKAPEDENPAAEGKGD